MTKKKITAGLFVLLLTLLIPVLQGCTTAATVQATPQTGADVTIPDQPAPAAQR